MIARPLFDLSKISTLWTLCVGVMDALEKMDGNDARANRFFCRFMTEKDGPGLTALIEETVEVMQ